MQVASRPSSCDQNLRSFPDRNTKVVDMFVSTREMLGQTSLSRTCAEAVIREHYGPECDIQMILRELSTVSLHSLGFDAFSDEALQEMASFLREQNQKAETR